MHGAPLSSGRGDVTGGPTGVRGAMSARGGCRSAPPPIRKRWAERGTGGTTGCPQLACPAGGGPVPGTGGPSGPSRPPVSGPVGGAGGPGQDGAATGPEVGSRLPGPRESLGPRPGPPSARGPPVARLSAGGRLGGDRGVAGNVAAVGTVTRFQEVSGSS